MIDAIPPEPVPAWLAEVGPELGPPPIAELLRDSLCYPASLFHGGPIRLWLAFEPECRPEKYLWLRGPLAKSPFATWVVFERTEPTAAPDRFSLLHVCADGVGTFEALYATRGISPRVLAIISPGTGFGGNWTDFRKSNRHLGRAVLGSSAIPSYLLAQRPLQGRPNPPMWPEYQALVHEFVGERTGSLWGR